MTYSYDVAKNCSSDRSAKSTQWQESNDIHHHLILILMNHGCLYPNPRNHKIQIKRCKQYITYPHHDKVFVLAPLMHCQSREEIAIGIKQLNGLYPNYYGLTVAKFICWRKASSGESKKPGVKVNGEFESKYGHDYSLVCLKKILT